MEHTPEVDGAGETNYEKRKIENSCKDQTNSFYHPMVNGMATTFCVTSITIISCVSRACGGGP